MKHIQIVTNLCTNEEGVPFGGGVERWSWDLSMLLANNGYSVELYQKGSSDTSLNRNKIKIISVKASNNFIGNIQFTKKLNKILDLDVLTIFVSHDLMLFSKVKKKLGVNHGNWWNGDFSFFKKMAVRLLQKHLLTVSSAIICVDTNYINWCLDNISDRKLWRDKLNYIPNYADLNKFKFQQKQHNVKKSYNILYPRRLNFQHIEENPRGLGLYLNTIDLLEDTDLKFKYNFLGRGAKLQKELREILIKKGIDSSRFEIKDVGLDEMPLEYTKNDIVVIPTIAQEGTSFSAIEAMASGCVTITTYVGGLPNIFIDSFNGLISNLHPIGLSAKIKEGVDNLERISGNTKISRKFFSKTLWDQNIIKIIDYEY